ncbi:serine hydrolase domain-containing protein [Tuwongella immobilis]|uniref:Beta-lactamase-related domain-containing protein n=1 Tax=Tuwongella immobilis TaxID=692036 RepID=A0A6C2YQB5_9BACT|nr:serine hydrolase domain-containing protein [Tuwongella immobilis]VIP03511.1 Penicillin-binding protein, beta-lactamase class C OS=Singulisphaera acidiphila (strain ATCC BAA-1392 / DSM 18658 / VKM B-2454 / MOB10) GN=Sinac_4395 PE=4 SV=1: Beta-lactamase [Tuwongella immobilis]VTS04390.1 Penicillin-binding protein, beta-lactamase class C OS=Singulisphaera acidiphila (strain ATCC BAA-1392 / DSM 18658 / VKM B-2454 / MOB10) GN=Sinac_4395 PE=4 SV=1: Beta-lactamase [Tuwongella immobilis]
MLIRAVLGALTLLLVETRLAIGEEPKPSIPMTGTSDPLTQSLDDTMRDFMIEHGVVGASVAVAKDGKLVYARGFGFADRDTKRLVQPNTRFRIASVSKPITAIAVLKLAEQGKLKLDEPMLPQLQLQPYLRSNAKLDERIPKITIRQLLQHTAGLDRAVSGDPVFLPRRIRQAMELERLPNTQEIVRYTLGKPLAFDPGTKYVYSNVGYSILGRLIEQASGMPYERYCQQQVLAPLGVTRMQIGRSRIADRPADETRYYLPAEVSLQSLFDDGKCAPPDGSWNQETLDAVGGWIASAPDLARVISMFDHPKLGVLKDSSIVNQLTQRPTGIAPKEGAKSPVTYYGLGFLVRPNKEATANTIWHNGRLDGTSSLMVRWHDGRVWVVLLNGSVNAKQDALGDLIDPILGRAVLKNAQWPNDDQFLKWLAP